MQPLDQLAKLSWYGGCSSLLAALDSAHFRFQGPLSLLGGNCPTNLREGLSIFFLGEGKALQKAKVIATSLLQRHTPCLAQGPLVTVWQAHEVSHAVLTCQSHLSTRC